MSGAAEGRCLRTGTHAALRNIYSDQIGPYFAKPSRTGCSTRAVPGRVHACPARLLHRLFRRHFCWSLFVRVEKLLGDLERAKLAVPSEDSVVLGGSSRCAEMGGGSRCGPIWAECGEVGNESTGAASVRLLGFFADRLLRHHRSQALLLRVIVKGSWAAGQ
eukprot:scaffold9600_cov65-Phaeocystis_antarctica.AAC.3